MRKVLFYILLLWPLVVSGQFADDFSNGNFTHDPPWTGDHDRFIVDQGMLRLNSEGAGVAWLSTPSREMRDTQWDFWVRMAFTPSDNNHPRIYLVSDRPDLSGALRGYFIQIGKTGTDNKRLYLCRQNGEEVTILLEGSMNLATTTNNRIRVRVTRDAEGMWELSADPSGGHLFFPEGSVCDDTFTTVAWFGISCTHTTTNSRRFYFDDFRVGKILPGKPPRVEKVEVVSAGSLDVYFSRVLDETSAGSVTNYLADGEAGHPLVAAVNPQKPHVVQLLFGRNFLENHLYTLNVSGVKGADGQLMEDYSGTFVHYVSARFDVVFNELMVNSRPVVQLPPHDWLELYNTTPVPVNLAGWTLQYGKSSQVLPEAVIPAKGCLLLTSEAAYPFLEDLFREEEGAVVGVPGLGVNALPMGGSTLVLYDDAGKMISHVSYSDSWYRDQSKAGGGWSLEKIDPFNYCQGAENWQASVDSRGGTPGAPNSVLAENPNVSVPELLRAGYVDSQTILLHFDQPMDDASLEQTSHYLVSEGIGPPESVDPQGPAFSSVCLSLSRPLSEGVLYKVEVAEEITDCAGNGLENFVVPVAVPVQAGTSDMVINEVLFNPPPGGSRYVEIYNRSENTHDLKDYLVASKDTFTGNLMKPQVIREESFLVFPGDYVVLSQDVEGVLETFETTNARAFAEVERLPGMTNRGGMVVLAGRGHGIIDELTFSEEMHLPLLVDRKGVALERLHPGRPSEDSHNWHSGAASTGFGTPGYRNAQQQASLSDAGAVFELSSPLFAPDGSGTDDVVQILYRMEEPGYVANVLVFDRFGREVKQLVNGEAMAVEGAFTWDGTTNHGQRASLGMYVVFLEVFNARGKVQTAKLPVVLAGQL
ncbi:MAG: lamin tail domain-containing protein [Bacteroidales bacterium]